MQINTLKVCNFRNLLAQEVFFPKRVTYLVGNNGQGKTNLLEAIYLLGHGISFRAVKNRDLPGWNNENPTSVQATLETTIGNKQIHYEIISERRTVYINDNRITKARDFHGQVPLIVFTPDDLQIVKGGPDKRRDYLDQLIKPLNPAYVDALYSYEKALKQRNEVIRSCKRENSSLLSKTDYLTPWEEQLAQHGQIIAATRLKYLQEINSLTQKFYTEIAGENNERIELGYLSDYYVNHEILAAANIKQLIRENLGRDERLAYTSTGIQRDELSIDLVAPNVKKPAQVAASQGQIRSIVLAIKLAALEILQREHQEAPLVLLDDIDSELDSDRLARLYETLSRSRNQTIITTTAVKDEALSVSQDYEIKHIEAGQINP